MKWNRDIDGKVIERKFVLEISRFTTKLKI